MKILLIDDHELFATSLKMVLESDKNIKKVTIVENPKNIPNLLIQDSYSIIILDIHLGENISGIELGRKIREVYPFIPSEIASTLLLSRRTIESELQIIYTKIGAKNSAEAVKLGIEAGVISIYIYEYSN